MNKIICEERIYGDHSYTHNHEYSQLILPLTGEKIIKTEHYNFSLDSDYLFYIPPEMDHEFFSESGSRFLVLDIPKSVIGSHFSKNQTEIYLKTDEKWDAIKFLLREEIKNGEAFSRNSLIHYMLSLIGEERKPLSIQYIHDNLDKDLSLKRLSKMENYNISYYVEWFRKKTGTTPNEYISNLRFKRAKEYLIHSDMSVIMISQMVGFKHQSSLNRLFKKHKEVFPTEYRKNNRNMVKIS